MVFEIFFNSFSKEIKIFLYKTINKERKKQRIQIYKNSVQITSCTNRKYITINIRIKHVSVKYSDHVQPTSYDLCLINTDSRVIIIILCIHMYKNIDYTPALCQTYLHTRSLHLSRSRGRREESSNRQTHRKLVIQIYLFFILTVYIMCVMRMCAVCTSSRAHICDTRIYRQVRCACVRACARMCMS